MSEESKRPRTDIERIEDALDGLFLVATSPGPDTQTAILNGIVEMRRRLKPAKDEA